MEIVPGKNDRGETIFSVIVKRTYDIVPRGSLKRSEEDRELRKIDQYYEKGDPEWATVQFENDLAPFKPSVDVVVIGKAYAPEGEPVPQMLTKVQIGDREKTIMVTGDRECQYRENLSPTFSDPVPFAEMEIRYERAYGGNDEKSIPEIPFFYPRNPLGTGVVLKNTKESVNGLALPNLEDPNDLLTPERLILEDPERWPEQPIPQGFGWFQRNWYPRCALVGAYPAFVDADTVTPEERAGLVPKNHIALAKAMRLPSFDARFNNGASFGLQQASLKGDEPIQLIGLTPEGLLTFSLPGERPTIRLDIGNGEQQLEAKLDTVQIRTEEGEVDLIWRGSLGYEGYAWLPHMTRLQAEVI